MTADVSGKILEEKIQEALSSADPLEAHGYVERGLLRFYMQGFPKSSYSKEFTVENFYIFLG